MSYRNAWTGTTIICLVIGIAVGASMFGNVGVPVPIAMFMLLGVWGLVVAMRQTDKIGRI